MSDDSSIGHACLIGVGVIIGGIGLWKLIKSSNDEIPYVLDGKVSTFEKDATTKQGFLELYEDLRDEIIEDLWDYDLIQVSGGDMKRMLDYNVPGGKLNRGLTVVQTVKAIKGDKMCSKLMKRAGVLGWCIEWLQASFLVADDLMDSSITRRGQPCWYKNEDVGFIAVNDSIILLTHVDVLLHKYFGENSDVFMQLHRIMTETTYQTELGQFLDLSTQPPQGPINLDLYTLQRHTMIVKYKTAFYSFYAPIALGMICAGVRDKKSLKTAKEICIKMGVYFQVQDDYLDCFGSPEVIGKIGTDIQDSKCSWLVVQALKRASKEDAKIIRENYGIDKPGAIATIKGVYEKLKLAQVYHDYEEKVYKELVDEIETKVNTVPKEIFYGLLKKIYKRSK